MSLFAEIDADRKVLRVVVCDEIEWLQERLAAEHRAGFMDLAAMIRALILCLCLTACASQPKPRPVNYGGPLTAENVCTIVENRLICIGGSTPEQQAEWVAYHTEPSIDKCEESALKTHRRVVFFDVGATGVLKLTCIAFAEGNPLGLPLALAAQPLVYKLDKDRHARTSRWDVDRFDDSQCGRDPVADMALVRAAFVGTGALAVLSVCL